ncbi:MAG: hypothetical protein M1812_005774 [Candelaria pacifica]|nr:MAG: hypothetical protein M1812_005774 [Candelaria pacifica]
MKLLAIQTPRRRSVRNAQNPNFPRPSTEMEINESGVDSDSASEYQDDDGSKVHDNEQVFYTPVCSDDDDENEEQEKVRTKSKGKERARVRDKPDHDDQDRDEPETKWQVPSHNNRCMTPKFQPINQPNKNPTPEVVVELPIRPRPSKVSRAKNRGSSVAKLSQGMITPVPSSPIAPPPVDTCTSSGTGASTKHQKRTTDGSTSKASRKPIVKTLKCATTSPVRSSPVTEIPESPAKDVVIGQTACPRCLFFDNQTLTTPGPSNGQIVAEQGSPSAEKASTSSKKRKKSISHHEPEETRASEETLAADVSNAEVQHLTAAKRSKVSKKPTMNSTAPRDSNSKPDAESKTVKSRSKKSKPASQTIVADRQLPPPHLTDLPSRSGTPGTIEGCKPSKTVTFSSKPASKRTSSAVQTPIEGEVHIKLEDDAAVDAPPPIYPPDTVKWKDKIMLRHNAEADQKQSQLRVAKLRLETDGLEWQDPITHNADIKKKSDSAKTAIRLAEAEQKRAEAERRLTENEKKTLERKYLKGKRRDEKERKRIQQQHAEEKKGLEQKVEVLQAENAAMARATKQNTIASRPKSDNSKRQPRETGRSQTVEGHGSSQQRPRPPRSIVYVVRGSSTTLADWVIAGVKAAFPSDDFNLYRHTHDKMGNAKLVNNWAVEFATRPLQVRLSANGITIPNTPGRDGKNWWRYTHLEHANCSFCKAEQHETLAHCPNLLFEMRSTHASTLSWASSEDGSLALPQNDRQSTGRDRIEPKATIAQSGERQDAPSSSCTEDVRVFTHKHGAGTVDGGASTIPKQHEATATTPATVQQPQSYRTIFHSRPKPPQQLLAARTGREAQGTDLALMLREERAAQRSTQPQYRRREVQPLRTLPDESGILPTELRNPSRRHRPSDLARREVAVTDSLPACVCRLLHGYFANGLVVRPCLGTFQGNEVEFWENIKQIVSCRGHDKEMITYCQGLWDGELARRNAIGSSAFEKSPPLTQPSPTRQPSQPPAYGTHLTDQFVQRGPRRETIYGPGRRETIPADLFYGPSASRTRPSCVGPEPASSAGLRYRQTSFRDFEGFLNASQSSGEAPGQCQQRMIELD